MSAQCQVSDALLFDVDQLWQLGSADSLGGLYRATITSRILPGTSLTLAPSLPGWFKIRNAMAAATAARKLGDSGMSIVNETSKGPSLEYAGLDDWNILRFWKDNFKIRRIFLIYGAMRDKAVDEIAGRLFLSLTP